MASRPWRSAAGMRSAARPAHSASSSAMASNMPVSRSNEGCATTAPRWARASTRPLATSWRSASRTGVRETLKRRAMSVSSSGAPGGSAPRTISSASCRRSSSARVILCADGDARSTRGTAGSAPGGRSSSVIRSGLFRLVDDADMGGDDAPALRELYPGLHLPADLARHRVAIEQGGGDGGVAAIAGDHGLRGAAVEADRRAPGAKAGDRFIAVEVLADAIAQRAGIVAEELAEHRDVVGDQGLLITLERGFDVRDHVGKIDLHLKILLGWARRRRPSSPTRTRRAARCPRARARR